MSKVEVEQTASPQWSRSRSSAGDDFRITDDATVDISVIIANYNSRELLDGCLKSIYSHPPERSFEVIVADDASTDGSPEMVREKYPQARLLANETNLGYSRSNNQAMSASGGRFIHLLNSDAEFEEGALDALAGFLEQHPEAGAAGTLLFNTDGTVQASTKALPSLRSAFFGKRSFLARLFPRSRMVRAELQHCKEGDEPYEAGYVSSASIMIPRRIVAEVGGLDLRLWHFVDADYCRRIWDTGHSVFLVPSARAVHFEHHGGTMAGVRKRMRTAVTFHYGAYIYFLKHGKPWWHPYHLLVVVGLSARFVGSVLFQAFKEISGADRRVYDRRRS